MRNKNAGKTPSYDKRNMGKKARANKKKYDKKFSSTAEESKHRSDCNKKRAEAKKKGMKIKGKDYDHSVDRFVSVKTNRGRKDVKSRTKGRKK